MRCGRAARLLSAFVFTSFTVPICCRLVIGTSHSKTDSFRSRGKSLWFKNVSRRTLINTAAVWSAVTRFQRCEGIEITFYCVYAASNFNSIRILAIITKQIFPGSYIVE
jgi:hypothetical protein